MGMEKVFRRAHLQTQQEQEAEELARKVVDASLPLIMKFSVVALLLGFCLGLLLGVLIR